jgi:hypothetical protein
MALTKNITVEEKFWSTVDRSGGPDACWLRSSSTFRCEVQHSSSRRFSYILTFGELPAGTYVHSTCRTLKCCNPRHLFVNDKANVAHVDEAARFWSKVDTSSENGCWMWMGARRRKGYGVITDPRSTKQRIASRVSYTLTYGEIPSGLCVCHVCDNPTCVRPDHLFLGTNADNIADKVAKQRQTRGEKHRNTHLTDCQIKEIRLACESGERQASVGRRFGISQSTVSSIFLRTTWRHV